MDGIVEKNKTKTVRYRSYRPSGAENVERCLWSHLYFERRREIYNDGTYPVGKRLLPQEPIVIVEPIVFEEEVVFTFSKYGFLVGE